MIFQVKEANRWMSQTKLALKLSGKYEPEAWDFCEGTRKLRQDWHRERAQLEPRPLHGVAWHLRVRRWQYLQQTRGGEEWQQERKRGRRGNG